jgi:hypothetical protein
MLMCRQRVHQFDVVRLIRSSSRRHTQNDVRRRCRSSSETWPDSWWTRREPVCTSHACRLPDPVTETVSLSLTRTRNVPEAERERERDTTNGPRAHTPRIWVRHREEEKTDEHMDDNYHEEKDTLWGVASQTSPNLTHIVRSISRWWSSSLSFVEFNRNIRPVHAHSLYIHITISKYDRGMQNEWIKFSN